MRNIIITGGELINKGAQAMTFITVHELRKRFPNHKIFLLSEMDLARPETERRQYNFDFMGWYPIKFARCQHNVPLRLLCKLRNGKELAEAEQIYRNCDAMVDVSGYALGSNWSDATCHRYLDHLEFARNFGIPVYLMPQSFGPFDFGADRAELDRRIRSLLPYARVVCAREKEGLDALKMCYGLDNVVLKTDLVLASGDIDIGSLYREEYRLQLPCIKPGSIGLVPNNRNLEVGNEAAVFDTYAAAIAHGLNKGKHVYLLHHSSVDVPLCRQLKARFSHENNVIMLEQEFTCLEFNELVRKFDYLIASRFHAVVHAFKNGVPCIVLGWAQKYADLLEQFDQRAYLFDVRVQPEPAAISGAMDRLEQTREKESETILSHLSLLQRENVFDVITL